MKTIISFLCVFAAAVVPARAETVERARYLMGSACRVVIDHAVEGRAEALAEKAFDEIARWEGILSDYDPASELSRLNGSGRDGFPASSDLRSFLALSARLSAETRGAFDLTAGALVDLYALRDGGRWPSDDEVASARARVGFERVSLDMAAGTVRLEADGMRLDPGAIGKGFALQRAAEVVRRGGATWALMDFGRQILVLGEGPDGCGVPVDVEPPSGSRDGKTMTLYLKDASVASSANSERGLVVDGRPLGHIMDPRTGKPATSSSQTTVVAADAGRADALSTAMFVMGPGEAMRTANRLRVQAIAWPADGSRPLLTPGVSTYFHKTCSGEVPAPPAPTPAIGQKGNSTP